MSRRTKSDPLALDDMPGGEQTKLDKIAYPREQDTLIYPASKSSHEHNLEMEKPTTVAGRLRVAFWSLCCFGKDGCLHSKRRQQILALVLLALMLVATLALLSFMIHRLLNREAINDLDEVDLFLQECNKEEAAAHLHLACEGVEGAEMSTRFDAMSESMRATLEACQTIKFMNVQSQPIPFSTAFTKAMKFNDLEIAENETDKAMRLLLKEPSTIGYYFATLKRDTIERSVNPTGIQDGLKERKTDRDLLKNAAQKAICSTTEDSKSKSGLFKYALAKVSKFAQTRAKTAKGKAKTGWSLLQYGATKLGESKQAQKLVGTAVEMGIQKVGSCQQAGRRKRSETETDEVSVADRKHVLETINIFREWTNSSQPQLSDWQPDYVIVAARILLTYQTQFGRTEGAKVIDELDDTILKENFTDIYKGLDSEFIGYLLTKTSRKSITNCVTNFTENSVDYAQQIVKNGYSTAARGVADMNQREVNIPQEILYRGGRLSAGVGKRKKRAFFLLPILASTVATMAVELIVNRGKKEEQEEAAREAAEKEEKRDAMFLQVANAVDQNKRSLGQMKQALAHMNKLRSLEHKATTERLNRMSNKMDLYHRSTMNRLNEINISNMLLYRAGFDKLANDFERARRDYNIWLDRNMYSGLHGLTFRSWCDPKYAKDGQSLTQLGFALSQVILKNNQKYLKDLRKLGETKTILLKGGEWTKEEKSGGTPGNLRLKSAEDTTALVIKHVEGEWSAPASHKLDSVILDRLSNCFCLMFEQGHYSKRYRGHQGITCAA